MEIPYSIEYSKRKKLSIIVERDRSVIVRAPLNTSEQVIKQEVNKRKNLLLNKINHSQKYEASRERKEFVRGESLLYLGKHYELEVVEDSIANIRFDNKFYISKDFQGQAEQLFKEWYFKQAETFFTSKAALYAGYLGVTYKAVAVVDLKYRWGTCTPRGNIKLNWHLIKAPIYVIDYVIVHELTHLLEPNHTPKFWNIVSVQLPHFIQAKSWLKENGHLLESMFS